ncbi:NAD dependent epimerase/dehydratase family [Alloalcanivorax dieselolei B5]|uniref:NAD dependent epimerase/dehydratase family n=2 Tax=Alloalcanivorax TaxID=3020832 RepID=K0CEZ2_ALCDB|nr:MULTISPECIES: SDR family oxidoreductase [Alloalcanivorax]AFT70232.1 NAD dependent epimerase/dehydratase family [Alloalcanivorax dieselolei B5]GGJ95434.1 oxidoreductase [Alloalcanivorax dieselolei]
MMASLADQVIWITGASSGIGEALAAEYARYGARLVLSARRREELERVRDALVNADQHLVLPLDLTDIDAMPAAVEQVMARFGRLDQVVHNGGISQRSLVRDTGVAVDQRIMAVNYFGAVALTKAVLPVFRAAKAGRFVVVTSLVGELPTPLRSAYSASKHALHGFFEALRAEEYDEGIRVTLVMPGFIRTQVSVNALVGDGSAQGTMDAAQEQGLAAEECARRVVEAVQRGRDQVIIAGRERMGVYLKRWCPPLYRRLIRKIKVT